MKMFYKSKGKNWIFLQFAPFGQNLFLFFSLNYEFEVSIRSSYKSNIREPLSKDKYSPLRSDSRFFVHLLVSTCVCVIFSKDPVLDSSEFVIRSSLWEKQ